MLPRFHYAIGTGNLDSLVSNELAQTLEILIARLGQEPAMDPASFEPGSPKIFSLPELGAARECGDSPILDGLGRRQCSVGHMVRHV